MLGTVSGTVAAGTSSRSAMMSHSPGRPSNGRATYAGAAPPRGAVARLVALARSAGAGLARTDLPFDGSGVTGFGAGLLGHAVRLSNGSAHRSGDGRSWSPDGGRGVVRSAPSPRPLTVRARHGHTSCSESVMLGRFTNPHLGPLEASMESTLRSVRPLAQSPALRCRRRPAGHLRPRRRAARAATRRPSHPPALPSPVRPRPGPPARCLRRRRQGHPRRARLARQVVDPERDAPAPPASGACGWTKAPAPGGPTTPPTPPTTHRLPPTTPPTTNPPATGQKKVVGYFTEWGVYDRNYDVKNIDTSGSASQADAHRLRLRQRRRTARAPSVTPMRPTTSSTPLRRASTASPTPGTPAPCAATSTSCAS